MARYGRTAGVAFGALLALLALLPAGATPPGAVSEAAGLAARVWPRRVSLRVRAEGGDALAFQISQQLMARVAVEEAVASRSFSIFAPDCSVGELRDGLAALGGYRLEPFADAESVRFRLRPGLSHLPRAVRAPRPTAAVPRSGRRPDGTASSVDPTLRTRLDFSTVTVDDEAPALPTLLESLSDAASILVLAEGLPMTSVCPGKMSTSRFLAGLHGLTLGEALDRTARAFNVSWSRSGRWFLMRPHGR